MCLLDCSREENCDPILPSQLLCLGQTSLINPCTVSSCVCAQPLSPVQLFVIPWTADHQAPLSMHGISQARTLEWVTISFSGGSSWLRNQTGISCLGRWILYQWGTWKAWAKPLNFHTEFLEAAAAPLFGCCCRVMSAPFSILRGVSDFFKLYSRDFLLLQRYSGEKETGQVSLQVVKLFFTQSFGWLYIMDLPNFTWAK